MSNDDMVLVPRYPTEWQRVHGRECDAKIALMDAIRKQLGRWPYNCDEADKFVGELYAAMVAAYDTDPERKPRNHCLGTLSMNVNYSFDANEKPE